MSNLVDYAERELRAAGLFDKDSDYDGMLGEAVLDLVKVFAEQGHSGHSAAMVRQIFNKVADYQPLSPLTGEDDEWNEFSTERGGGVTHQNKRCSRVMKDGKDGQAFDIEGRVFRDPDGFSYTSKDSSVDVTFPYTPKTEYVDVPASTEE